MFDLDNEVRAWCTRIHATNRTRDTSFEELVDHLHCEIERLKEEEGMAAEEAFRAATARLGDAQTLEQEYNKNRTLFGRACHLLLKYEKMADRKYPVHGEKAAGLIVSHALLWATVMIASALILSAGTGSEFLLLFVYIPVWFASEQLLRRAIATSNSV